MLSKEQLEQLRNMSINNIDSSSLTRAEDITLDPSHSIEERYRRYLEQIQNPYAFMCNGAVVKVGFSSTDRTLDQSLTHFFTELNNSTNT